MSERIEDRGAVIGTGWKVSEARFGGLRERTGRPFSMRLVDFGKQASLYGHMEAELSSKRTLCSQGRI